MIKLYFIYRQRILRYYNLCFIFFHYYYYLKARLLTLPLAPANVPNPYHKPPPPLRPHNLSSYLEAPKLNWPLRKKYFCT